ncbi:intraflagellar transport protein 20 [Catenaria anguillulae PL171]|uniref:Intraflagellar transport protein 20 n=1 Tax=Catenaria anguillulae PL171 TaxID=765915 RepID=A0A1Y2HKD7_9FUNG|nr:intraflagellar transport protein 20 [Catenaria anguillulae PL171]
MISQQNSNTAAVSFDDLGRLRLVPAPLVDASDKLREECRDFSSKVTEFSTLVTDILNVVEAKAREIEKEKLKAIALRTAVEREPARRTAELNRISFLLRERQMQLDRISGLTSRRASRLMGQYETYAKMEQDQQAVIDQLTAK